jgi:hypothetical protein
LIRQDGKAADSWRTHPLLAHLHQGAQRLPLICSCQDPLTGGESEEEEEVVDMSGEPAAAMSRLSSTESDPDDPSVALLSAHGTHLLVIYYYLNQ